MNEAEKPSEAAPMNRSGATLRLFGVVLLLLGALNSLLAWRGGQGPGNFPVLLAGAGILAYVLGAIYRLRGEVS